MSSFMNVITSFGGSERSKIVPNIKSMNILVDAKTSKSEEQK